MPPPLRSIPPRWRLRPASTVCPSECRSRPSVNANRRGTERPIVWWLTCAARALRRGCVQLGGCDRRGCGDARPVAPLEWMLEAAGVASLMVGDIVWDLYAFRWRREHPVGDILDASVLTAGATLLLSIGAAALPPSVSHELPRPAPLSHASTGAGRIHPDRHGPVLTPGRRPPPTPARTRRRLARCGGRATAPARRGARRCRYGAN